MYYFVILIKPKLFITVLSTTLIEWLQKVWVPLNPIPAGALENPGTLGGVNLTPPPSKSHVLCPNMTNDTSLESSWTLLLESAKKFANLRKLNFLSQNPVLC